MGTQISPLGGGGGRGAEGSDRIGPSRAVGMSRPFLAVGDQRGFSLLVVLELGPRHPLGGSPLPVQYVTCAVQQVEGVNSC